MLNFRLNSLRTVREYNRTDFECGECGCWCRTSSWSECLAAAWKKTSHWCQRSKVSADGLAGDHLRARVAQFIKRLIIIWTLLMAFIDHFVAHFLQRLSLIGPSGGSLVWWSGQECTQHHLSLWPFRSSRACPTRLLFFSLSSAATWKKPV